MRSIFSDYSLPPPRPPLMHSLSVDVAVIGGGMAGVLIAHRLAECGATVAVLEAHRIGSGQTAGTTAKLTAQHGDRYRHLIRRYGVTAARLYATANLRAIDYIRHLVAERDIACDFTEADAYVYSLTDRAGMEGEAKAQAAAGLPVQFDTHTELPVPVAGAVICRGQAHFHPQKFLQAVADPLSVYEFTPVKAIRGHTLFCEGGQVTAAHIVFACHYPFVNLPGLYFTRLHQERSYVLAVGNVRPPKGMYWTPDKGGLSLRPYGDRVLVGGSGHRCGEQAGGHYDELRRGADRWFPGGREVAHWSAQDVMPPDDLPYIGRFSAFRPYWHIATGFGKWGMTTSAVAAHLLAEEIGGRILPESALFSPTRFGWRDTGAVLHETGHALKGLTRLWLSPAQRAATKLAPGEGGIVRLDGRQMGVYHSPEGKWYAVSPRCTHLGCTLTWNPEETSWDCPCHGSRFDVTGRRLNGPAQRDLHYKSWSNSSKE